MNKSKHFLKYFLFYVYYKYMFFWYKKKSVFLYWFNVDLNFGDTINPLLIEVLTKKKVIRVEPRYSSITYVTAIGSIIEHTTSKSMIWGSGFISQNSILKNKPLKVLAVRGPKSRKRFLDLGIECPEVYGDPALLLPAIYKPKIKKKYSLGIIPHIFDKNNEWILKNCQSDNIKVIDLQQENMFDVIDDILACEKIASSSLHGIITADAYGVPSIWIEFSDKVIGKGFKFLDYFESVGRKDTQPLCIQDKTCISNFEEIFYDYSIDIDLKKLIDAAPFKINVNI